MTWVVLCADDYAGEWATPFRDDAERHARNLDATCSCGGPHIVIENDRIDDV